MISQASLFFLLKRLIAIGSQRCRSAFSMARSGTELGLIILFATTGLAMLSLNPIWQDSDGLIGTLFSLQHMTLFFWGQDRFANLTPMLSMPIHDPELNAYIQLLIRVYLGVISPLFACVFLTNTTQDAWRATLISSALLLMCAPHVMQHDEFIQASPYGMSFALAGLSLLVFRRVSRLDAGRAILCRLGGLALMMIVFLVNYAFMLTSIPLLFGEFILFGTEFALSAGIASLVALAFSNFAATHFSDALPTPGDFGDFRVGLTALARELVGASGIFIPLMLVTSLLLHVWLRHRDGRAQDGARAGHAALVVVTLVFGGMIVSVSSWVITNRSDPRYLLPSYILAASVCGSAVFQLIKVYCRKNGLLILVVSLCFLVVAIARPAPQAPDGIIEPVKRPLVEAVASLAVARSLDGIEGDYWDVWPSVFEAERMNFEAGMPVGQVFGLTFRGEARKDAFAARLLRQGRLNILCIDPSPGHCNAATLVTMEPPATEMKVTAPPIRLQDGTLLTFLTIETVKK